MLLQLDLTKKLNILYKIVGTTYYKRHKKDYNKHAQKSFKTYDFKND